MSVDTFVPPLTPSPGTSDKPEMKILQADFGDGYTQATRNGMNNIRRVVTLKWDVLPIAFAQQIIAFFNAHGGTDPFFYTIPGETIPVLWTCAEYDDSFKTNAFKTVNATLRQSFNIV